MILRLKASKSYDIHIENGLIPKAGALCRPLFRGENAAIITDETVDSLYANALRASLEKAGFKVCKYVVRNGERSKNINTLADILEFFAFKGLTREDSVFAFGGGVIGDLGGFAAAIYMRGIGLVQLPTTLLAAVDSSIGGKTAIDLKGGKNLAGAFYQPAAVLCDCDIIEKLPEEIFADGMGEVIKYGLLGDTVLLNGLSDGSLEIRDIICRCAEDKIAAVEADERDKGARRFLNLGHTFAHAIERHSGYGLTHGKAVALGMLMTVRAAEKKGYCGDVLSRLILLLKKYSLPTEYDIDGQRLYDYALSDKKRQNDGIVMILPEKYGACFMRELTLEEFREFCLLATEEETS